MEEEFQVCGGNWWNSSRNLFGPSPCAAAVNDPAGWLNPNLIVDTKTKKSLSDDSTASSDGGGSVVLQEPPKPQLIESGTLEMISDDWNSQDLIHDSARSQENYSFMNNYQGFLFDQPAAPPPPATFPLNTASYGYTSSLLQNLYDTNLLHTPNLGMNNSTPSSMMRPTNNFQFVNNTAPFWNESPAGEVRPSFLPSSTPQLIPSALNKVRLNQQDLRSKAESAAKKSGSEPSFKRPRIETPSPLPTFKVRKEKLGDRVTALQQLVSPFGKTDTASVLHEAIEYIKLLHDQVTVLSTPYLKNGQPPLQHQQVLDKIKDQEEPMKDLRSRGLCLVPISSTFPVATETTADFWTPTFASSFR